MADKATAERVAADMSPPGYRQAVQRIRTIQPHKEKIAKVNGDISDIWAKVEGHKVDKRAGRIFLILDRLEPVERMMVFRDLNGLADSAGWEEQNGDLVDTAQNKVVNLRMGAPATAQETDDEISDMENGGQVNVEAGEEPAPAAAAANDFLANARKHLSGNKKKGDPEPYNGDNSDLAGDAPGKPH